jgi:steroid delta-isomerase-like uncharacterized protein
VDHTTTMHTLYERINAGDIDGFGALLADDLVEHEELPGQAQTKEGTLEFFRGLRVSFPDMNMAVEDVITSDAKSVARVVFTGTHRGAFMGVPPSGNTVDVHLIDIMRFDDAGLVSEHWGVLDSMTLMQQLGVVPDGPPA